MEKYTYGAMSSKYKLEADNKLTAYATIVFHYKKQPHLVVIYTPESSKDDSWFNPCGKVADRLDEIFGGKDSFVNYLQNNIEAIRTCYKSIKKIV